MDSELTVIEHNFLAGDTVKIKGLDKIYIVKKVLDANTIKIRDQWWFEKLWWRISLEIKDAFSFLFI